MVRIKVFKLSQLIYYAVIILVLVVIIALGIRMLTRQPAVKDTISVQNTPQVQETRVMEEQGVREDNPETPVSRGQARPVKDPGLDEVEPLKDTMKQAMPVLNADPPVESGSNFLSLIWRWVFDFNLRDPKTIFSYQLPVMKGVKMEEQAVLAQLTSTPEEVEEEIFLKNEEEIPEEIKIEIGKIENDFKPIEITGEGPQVLIYHTHTRESYTPTAKEKYVAAGNMRTLDSLHNVNRIGDELAAQLKKEYGIDVLHDRTDHEPHSTSYTRSLATVTKQMKKYSSLKMFIDVHRNAYDSKSKKKREDEIVMIDGKPVAKMMVVIGTGKGKTGAGFSVKPNWKENYKLAQKITDELNKIKPGLAKPVLVKTGRYNQHVSTKAILVEVGSTLNTLEDAQAASVYLAKAIHEATK